jgi:type I restriction enzyme M protein
MHDFLNRVHLALHLALRPVCLVACRCHIHDDFLGEVKPHLPAAWIERDTTKIGYEISFRKYVYRHKSLRPIAEVSAEIMAVAREKYGSSMEILGING